MKKLALIGMAALLIMAASCRKDKIQEQDDAGVFRATVESHSGDSKTHMEGLSVLWNANDSIKVTNGTNFTGAIFRTNNGGSEASFGALGEIGDDFYTGNYIAGYPAKAFTFSESAKGGTVISLSLPSKQTCADGSFGNGANPTVAVSATTDLQFKNICGVLKLKLYHLGQEAVSVGSITLTSKKAGENLWGTGTVTVGDDGVPSLGTLSSGGNSLTLKCGGSIMSMDQANPSVYCFVVPDGTLSEGFTVEVKDTGGNVVWNISTSKANAITRSRVKAMPRLKILVEGAIQGLFSVSEDKQVYFSKGNLQATYHSSTSSYTWGFAANQHDFIGGEPGNTTINNQVDGGVVDLFGWSTASTNYGISSSTNNNTYSGDFRDWGETIGDGETWFTLSKEQWDYLKNRKVNGKNCYSWINKNGLKGLIIYPDNTPASDPDYIPDGCVFLPAGGFRSSSGFSGENYCYHWSSSKNGDYEACRFQMQSGLYSSSYVNRYNGCSVRLVTFAD